MGDGGWGVGVGEKAALPFWLKSLLCASISICQPSLPALLTPELYTHARAHTHISIFQTPFPCSYDNPQLAQTYLAAFQLTGDTQYAVVARDVLDYLMRDMTHPEGGFYAAEVSVCVCVCGDGRGES